MFSPRWRKVIADLWGNKTRSLLVILSIATGVFAVGMVADTYTSLLNNMNQSYNTARPAHAILRADEPFEEELIDTIQGMNEIESAEALAETMVKVETGPGQWERMRLIAVSEFKGRQLNCLQLVEGSWPPSHRELLLERSSMDFLTAGNRQVLRIESNSGKQYTFSVKGLVHDAGRLPSFFTGEMCAYINFDTLEMLTGDNRPDTIIFRIPDSTGDREEVRSTARLVEKKMENWGVAVEGINTYQPGEHPMADSYKTIMLILGILGFMALFLGTFLVVNTISALLTQQLRQIGVMKAMGAKSGQIIGMYLTMVVVFGSLALLIAMPLSFWAAQQVMDYVARVSNFTQAPLTIPMSVVILEIVVGLLVPLIGAIFPILRGVSITVREAISDYGIGGMVEQSSWLNRLSEKTDFLSRPALISLRNSFRRKGRMALTLATLTMAGAIFIAVFSVRASMLETTSQSMACLNYDIQIDFEQSYRTEKIEQKLLSIPGVAKVECWGQATADVMQNGQSSDRGGFVLQAPPAGADMFKPEVITGRWLMAEDENALVINSDIVKRHPYLKVGQVITLKTGTITSQWQVVGVVRGTWSGPVAYANYEYLSGLTRKSGQASSVMLRSSSHEEESRSQLAGLIESHLKSSGMKSQISTIDEFASRITAQFVPIQGFLLLMALLTAVVGGLGLMGTIGINVLERTRETGVMRAIGASTRAILNIFIMEGIVTGIVSWGLAIVLALPISKLMSDQVGIMFSGAAFDYKFSLAGVVFWLLLVIIISAAASLAPAMKAARLSVREVLAYE